MANPKPPKKLQERLDPRRQDFVDLRVAGKTLNETVQIISDRYHVSKIALYKDWEHRARWGPYANFQEDDKYLVQDIVNAINDLVSKLTALAEDPKTTRSERRRIYSKLLDVFFKKLEAYQSLGKVHSEPLRFRIEEQVERLSEIVTEVAGDDEIAQENLMRVILRYAESESSDN